MKSWSRLSLTLCFILFLANVPIHAQLITGFGSSEFNGFTSQDIISPWTGTINPNNVVIANQDNQFGGFSEDLTTGTRSLVNIGVSTQLLLSGNLTNLSLGAAESFQAELFDAEFDSVVATFKWSDFSGGASVTSNLDTNVNFSGIVSYWNLNLAGLSGETVSFNFESLAAVPEPATIGLVGMTIFASMFYLRRKKSRSAS